MPDPRELVADLYAGFAAELADAARPIIAPRFRQPIEIEAKQDGSPVTIADREAERALRGMIEQRHPRHGIIGEEFEDVRADAEWVWALDPIDGTGAFISGVPTFATLIALLHEGRPVLGIIDQPVLRERWIGAIFEGAPRRAEFAANGGIQQLHTSSTADLTQATGFATTPDMFRGGAADAWNRLAGRLRRARYGIDAYAYGLLAMGRIDLVCEAQLKPWDYLALVPIVRAAGGEISDWAGRPLTASSGDRVLAAASLPLHRAALAALSDGDRDP